MAENTQKSNKFKKGDIFHWRRRQDTDAPITGETLFHPRRQRFDETRRNNGSNRQSGDKFHWRRRQDTVAPTTGETLFRPHRQRLDETRQSDPTVSSRSTAGSSGMQARNTTFRGSRRPQFRSYAERVRTFGYESNMNSRYIKKLLQDYDPQSIIMKLSENKDGFSKLLNDNDIDNDMIVIIIQLLHKICQSAFQEAKISIIILVMSSHFMDELVLFIISIASQSLESENIDKTFWSNGNEFWNNLIGLCRTVHQRIPSYSGKIKQLLTTLKTYIPIIENTHHTEIPSDAKRAMNNLLDLFQKQDDLINADRKKDKIKNADDDIEPPNDFRDIEIMPTMAELMEETSFLRPNIVDRPYKSAEQYSDIQFRLLREDFIAPLRRSIHIIISNESKPKCEWEKLENVRLYKNVRFIDIEIVNELYCYKVQFNSSRLQKSLLRENSKILIFGSLISFTPDNFQTILFGTVVNRDPELVVDGYLIVGFDQIPNINFNCNYLMIESEIYFEPYSRVLRVLKEVDIDIFPMKEYIIDLETTVGPPSYWQDNGRVFFKIEDFSVNPLNFPIKQCFYNLNVSQLEAFKAALSKAICIIQGPPGTGKTFLGLKIAQVLLENSRLWYNRSPILVVCYTNHALDQFLEGLLPIDQEIIRVGGRSKNENLKPFNLSEHRIPRVAAAKQKRLIFEIREQFGNISKILRQISSKECIINFSFFECIEGFRETWFDEASSEEIASWLMYGKQFHQRTYNKTEEAVKEAKQTDNFEDTFSEFNIFFEEHAKSSPTLLDVDRITPLLSVIQLQELINDTNLELERMKGKDIYTSEREKFLRDIVRRYQEDIQYLKNQLAKRNPGTHMYPPKNINLISPYYMDAESRWELYFYWLDILTRKLRQDRSALPIEFSKEYQVYKELRQMEETAYMKSFHLIGMTTTGAARLQSSLQSLESPIVIVEEAAEVLESHVVSCLTAHCKHLILIGDHLQLKPGTADFKINRQFKFGISLFERLVKNQMQCHTLNVQHRMIPEISSLIKPSIYPNLEDHESTFHREPILGMVKSLYFIDHKELEETCDETTKKNIHEVTFLIALARHLILNGYEPQQITILVTYLGQMYEMQSEKKKSHNREFLENVRIAVLDNYQGEESDIILLSLVRNNIENRAGFLKIQNRVCVALSRARNGLYIMGNMELLLNCNSENNIWHRINETLRERNAIGETLQMRCQIHPSRITHVKTASDFQNISEGGCNLICGSILDCNHLCKTKCHVQNRDHTIIHCSEVCNKPLCAEPQHLCKKFCGEECGPCNYLVPYHLKCGHDASIECHIQVDTYKCKVKELTMLPCNHQADKPCFLDPEDQQCPYFCDARLDCGHTCKRNCHIFDDPDHIEYRCISDCVLPNKDCAQEEEKHMCQKICFEDCDPCTVEVKKLRSCGHMCNIACHLDVEKFMCDKPCKKKLSCGHPCKNKCFAPCGSCRFKVDKKIPECDHIMRMECFKSPERFLCINQTCPRLLPCGHNCKETCRNRCTINCQETIDCEIKSPCGHIIRNITCNLSKNYAPEDLLIQCTEPCGITLKCGHRCTGSCAECKQLRIHKRCSEKCGAILVCNHECKIPCRQSCEPCTRKCEIKCIHNKCKRKCGQPCAKCNEKCPRRCPHVRCTKTCGEICNVDPCAERCPKKLRCGHPCVGFCSDPCPNLCRICNHDELTEIFLGNEDNPEAIYVMLNECKHIFEHSDLENWMKTDQDQIKYKVCPRCKINITTTERYSTYIKRALNDVIAVKMHSYGNLEENDALRIAISNQLLEPYKIFKENRLRRNDNIIQLIEEMYFRLKPNSNKRKQMMNKIELYAIHSRVQILLNIKNCYKDTKFGDTNEENDILNLIVESLQHIDSGISDQTIEDIELEILRLNRILQFLKFKPQLAYFKNTAEPDVKLLVQKIEKDLFAYTRFSNVTDSTLATNLKELGGKLSKDLPITDVERVEIVKAMNLRKGHWYKCPNGHPYAIGECGGANQIAKCICGADIGGMNHRLLPSNAHAGEMDSSTRHAWPGGLY